MTNSAPDMNQHQASSASPAREAAKRRHTAAFASERNASPEKGLKRTKTLKTYGGSRRRLEPADDGNFDDFRDDEGGYARTSQSARFSEHSGHQSSMPLPAGSLQTDFLNHEPAVMFKDTGDTVADASSEQQRMLEQVLASKKGLSTSVTKEAQQRSEHQSSSIPWTASDIADSAKSRRSRMAAEGRDGTEEGPEGDEGALDEPTEDHEPPADDEQPPSKETEPANEENLQPAHSQSKVQMVGIEKKSKRPKSSPMVEIYPEPSVQNSTVGESVKTKQRSAKSRNQNVHEESSEPLNSDEKAIGLLKERYIPRPSRRRATQVAEDPIDYSKVPEKAAKVKRTKTTGARVSVSAEDNGFGASQETRPGVSPSGLSKDALSEDARKQDVSPSEIEGNESKINEDESPVKPRRRIRQGNEEPLPPNSEKAEAQHDAKAEVQEDEDKVFVKPAIPTPKPKAASKVKRAQTTIFEDHVEFMGSRRSPNLSQQQAKRKSALQDVQNEAAPKSERKRKSSVADDSDDEDELAKENEDAGSKEKSPPKKRRGRPPKSEKQTQPKATDSVMKDSDQEDEEDELAAEDSAEEKPPKKRGRGRPAKSASTPGKKPVNKTAKADRMDDEPEKPADEGHEARQPEQPASTPSKPSAPATEMPTPSPEQPPEKPQSTPQKGSSHATTQHSPIKSSSKVPFRVGLSKKNRIPSLLRVMRPPKK